MAHILVVDDDALIRCTLSDYIRNLGHQVAIASDGVEAIRYIDAHPVDLMVLDFIMPNQDGIRTILKIMTFEQRPAIIVVSGGSRSLDADFIQVAVERLPISAFICKPIDYDALGSTIEKALQSPLDRTNIQNTKGNSPYLNRS